MATTASTTAPQLTELGYYTLAGHADSPRSLIGDCRRAAELGLGSTFISERFNVKDAAVLSGAVGAASETLGIATAAGSLPSAASDSALFSAFSVATRARRASEAALACSMRSGWRSAVAARRIRWATRSTGPGRAASAESP